MTIQNLKVFTIANKKEGKFLRQKTAPFDFEKYERKEINELIKKMRQAMEAAEGIGLSANQLGLDMRFFVAKIPIEVKSQKSMVNGQKFYAIFNPEIIKFSKEKSVMEEGCLSAPGIFGLVERPEKITLVGYDRNGKKLKIKAWGLLARVFQHEIDHLNGILFIDKCKEVYKLETNRNL